MSDAYHLADDTAPEQCGRYVLEAVRIEDVIDEFEPLVREGHASVYASVPFRLDVDLLVERDRIGGALAVTARRGTRPAGFLAYLIGSHIHSRGHITADEVGFWISPSERRGWLALQMMRFAEACLQDEGVHAINMYDHHPAGGPDVSALYQRQSFRADSRAFVKELSTHG